MNTLDELEKKIGQYLLLEDRGIIKLLVATVIANRIPSLDSTWLFIVSSSSGGKSELLLALAYAAGVIQKDDLTAKTFISGAKSGDTETSFLFRLKAMHKSPVLLIKDLTVLLKKDPREGDAIFSQLRMIYDGTLDKSFGTGEDVAVKIRMGLIAGVTSEIEDHQSDEAAVGQRALQYYMKQPPEEKVNALTEDILAGKQDKKMRIMIGEAFKNYIDGNKFEAPYLNDEAIPELSLEIRQDLAKLSNMATKARSSIKRNAYARGTPITRKNLREMPFRFAKQLGNLARSFIAMNGGELLPLDKHILYKIALDSIPSGRKEVMAAATSHALGITLEGLATTMRLPEESARIQLEDLVALEIIDRVKGTYNNKFVYKMRDEYREVMAKFENIEIENTMLEDEQAPLPEEAPLTAAEQQLLEEVKI